MDACIEVTSDPNIVQRDCMYKSFISKGINMALCC